MAVHLLAKQWKQKLFIYSSCVHYQTCGSDPRKLICHLRNHIVPWGTKAHDNDQPFPKDLGRRLCWNDWWKVRGKRRLSVDWLAIGSIFICILVSNYCPKRHSLLNLPPPQSQVYSNTFPTYIWCATYLCVYVSSNIIEVASKVMCLGSVCFFLICRKQMFSVTVSLSLVLKIVLP